MASVETIKAMIRKFAGLLSGKGVSIVYRGDECHTDGRTITLPALELLEAKGVDREAARRYLDAIVGFVVHEVGHVLHSDFTVWVREAPRMPELARHLTNAIEDAYVERETCRVWEGAADSLDNCYTWVMARDKAVYRGLPHGAQIVAYLCHALRGVDRERYAPHFDPRVVRWVDRNLKAEMRDALRVIDTKGSIGVAKRIFAKIKAREDSAKDDAREENKRGADTGDTESRGSDPNEGESDNTEDNGDDRGASARDGDDPDSDDRDRDSDNERGDPSDDRSKATSGEAPDQDEIDIDDIDDMGDLDDVSDAIKGGFSELVEGTGGCSSKDTPYTPYNTSNDYDGPIKPKLSPEHRAEQYEWLSRVALRCTGALKGALGRTLLARGAAYDVRALERGRLDKRRLWHIPVARAQDTAPRVFADTVVSETYNVAVLVLVDQSGSMDAPACNVDGHSLTRSEVAIAATFALGDALSMLRIPFAVLGHATGDYGTVDREQENACGIGSKFSRFGATHFNWVKTFRQDWRRQRKHTVNLTGQIANHDAEAVWYSVQRLREVEGVTRRILLVLNDGEPEGTTPYTSMNKRQQRELKDIVKRVKDVEIIGVGMATDNVEKYYPENIVVNEMEQLPKLLLEKLGSLLGLNRKRRR